MKAIIAALILAVLLIAGAAAVPLYILSQPMEDTPGLIITPAALTNETIPEAVSEAPETEPPPDPVITDITLTFVGDCMLATDRGGEYQGSFNLLANQVEPSYFFENFLELFENDDWTIANLENVFTDDATLQPRNKGYTPAYWYKSKTANTAILTEGSIEIVSLANNHSTDYGTKGYEDTREALDAAGVQWGDNEKILMLEKEGFTIALYCTTFYYTGYDTIISKKMAEIEADYKIVYFHGGTERVHEPDAWKAAGCRRMIDNGIDLVIGGHPHVLQPIEIYKGKTIVHSLGNFVFGGSRSEENRTIVYRLYIQLTDGEVTSITDEVIPCYVYTDLYQPGIIENEAEIQVVHAFLRGETDSPINKK
ncbi:MAG: CapA family protein [Clostridia bacterium]|nr:CapA family protein [Clostridia bacterium]